MGNMNVNDDEGLFANAAALKSLKNIRKSIEKYNGYMKITTTDQVFSVGVFLYVDDM